MSAINDLDASERQHEHKKGQMKIDPEMILLKFTEDEVISYDSRL
jgi:hypothetical protein